MIFGKAVDIAIHSNLKENKKFILMGLGVSYGNKPFFSNFPSRVLETLSFRIIFYRYGNWTSFTRF